MSIISRSIASIGYSQGPRSVSSVGYLANQQDGRSGYWRLFFTQLQEQSEQPKQAKVKLKEKTLADYGIKVVKAKPVAKTKRATVQPSEVETESPARTSFATPVTERKVVENDTSRILSDAWVVTLQIRSLVSQYNVTALQIDVKKRRELDDEEALLALLL